MEQDEQKPANGVPSSEGNEQLAGQHEEQKTLSEAPSSEGPQPRVEEPKDFFKIPKPKKRTWMILGAIVFVVLVGGALFYFLYLGSPGRQTLASVNGEKITVAQFNHEVEKVGFPERDMYKEEPKEFLQGMILKRLLLQEAKKQGIAVPEKTYKDTEKDALSPDDVLVGELMKKKFSATPAVTREEIKEFYEGFKDRMEGKKLDEVAPMIEKIIQEGKQREAVESYLGEIQKNAKIEINEDRLKKIAAKPPESNSEDEFTKALQSGKPTLVDFGANNCQPCRLMRPVLKEIDKENAPKAQVLVIDVYKYQKLAQDFKVVFIPTLVFFDSKGKEVFRQVGVMEKDKIVAKLKEIGMPS